MAQMGMVVHAPKAKNNRIIDLFLVLDPKPYPGGYGSYPKKAEARAPRKTRGKHGKHAEFGKAAPPVLFKRFLVLFKVSAFLVLF